MKKVITILAVMIVLIGAVFAANSSLIVKASIAEVAPTFGLEAKGTNVSDLTMARYANADAQTAAITAQTGYATITDASALTQANGTVAVQFAIKQISDSSTTRGYHLSAKATNLVRVKDPATQNAVNGGTGAIGMSSVFSGEGAIDANDMFPVATGTNGIAVPPITAGEKSAVADYATNHVKGTANATTSTTLDLTYDGVKINAYATNIEVGQFTVTWNANPTARPGDYEACIELTVTAD